MSEPMGRTVNVAWDADDIPVRYRARDDRIDTTHSENGTVLASVPLPTRQQTRLDLARLVTLDGWTIVPSESATNAAAMQEDLHSILHALNLPTGARASSPHEVVEREVVPEIWRLRGQIGRLRDRNQQVDRPEPVDPASVREGNRVEITITGTVEGNWGGSIDLVGDDSTRTSVVDNYGDMAIRILHAAEPEPNETAVEALTDIVHDVNNSFESTPLTKSATNRFVRELVRRGVEVPDA